MRASFCRHAPAAAVLLLATACSPTVGTLPHLAPLPPPPLRVHPLALRMVYPPEARRDTLGDTVRIYADSLSPIQARDSSFIFGSVGRGDARLTVNGVPVPVYPTGGWIAWLPLPPDTVARFDLVAVANGDTARAVFVARLPRRFAPPDSAVWIDTASFVPRGARWLSPGEGLRLGVRAAPGAEVTLVLPDGRRVPFTHDRRPEAISAGARAFGSPSPVAAPPVPGRYLGWWADGPLGPDPGPVMAPAPAPAIEDTTAAWATLEAVVGADTARAPWPLRLAVLDPAHPAVVVVNDDTAHTGRTDSTLAGRPAPGATYYWLFPNSTVARVSGRFNDQVRLQLSSASAAWVDAADVQRIAAPPPAGTARSVRLVAGSTSVTLRVPLPGRVPFRVDESGNVLQLRLYGVAADMDWMRYGGTDPFVRLLEYHQPAEDETVVVVTLAQPVYGYRTRWDGDDLLLEIRRPPMVRRNAPLRGRTIAVDAGHPPLGATGPTGVREPDITLAVAWKVDSLLTRAGATVVMVRPDARPLDLNSRVRIAERANADAFVSVHANGLPDGINPFSNVGTSTYYYYPQSAALARDLDEALVGELGFPDLGFGRGDLAVVRQTWMPAALTEGLFLQMPDQEAVLGSAAGQWRYAQGIVDGLAKYFRETWGK